MNREITVLIHRHDSFPQHCIGPVTIGFYDSNQQGINTIDQNHEKKVFTIELLEISCNC